MLALLEGSDLKVLAVERGGPRVLDKAAEETGIAPTRSGIAWMPDGQHILFQKRSQGGDAIELWRIATDTGEADNTGLSWSEGGFRHLRVNPDGRRITFSAKAQDERNEVWVLENFLPSQTKDPKQNPAK